MPGTYLHVTEQKRMEPSVRVTITGIDATMSWLAPIIPCTAKVQTEVTR